MTAGGNTMLRFETRRVIVAVLESSHPNRVHHWQRFRVAEFIVIIIGAALVNNLVLFQFMGVSPVLSGRVTARPDTAVVLSLFTLFLLLASAAINHLLYYTLLEPLDLTYLRLITFMLVIALLVSLLEAWLQCHKPVLRERLGIAVPMLAANTAILAASLLSLDREYGLAQSLAHAAGAGIGFGIVMLLFTGIRQRLQRDMAPRPFRGAAIQLISAGLLALGFIGFAGIV